MAHDAGRMPQAPPWRRRAIGQRCRVSSAHHLGKQTIDATGLTDAANDHGETAVYFAPRPLGGNIRERMIDALLSSAISKQADSAAPRGRRASLQRPRHRERE